MDIEELDGLTKMLAIDPGDRHVGLAFFQVKRGWESEVYDWTCTDTMEVTPRELEDSLLETLTDGELDIVVFERFLLDPTKLESQINSEMETSQLIGIIKYVVRMHNQHAQQHLEHGRKGDPWKSPLPCMLENGICYNRPERWLGREVKLVGQTPSIKKPTRGILNAKKIKSRAAANKDKLGHQKDAELHGFYYIHQGQFDKKKK